jgi:hypothetical protein
VGTLAAAHQHEAAASDDDADKDSR